MFIHLLRDSFIHEVIHSIKHLLIHTIPPSLPPYLGSAGHVHARYRQRGDVHGHTAVQVQRANQKQETPARDRPGNREAVFRLRKIGKQLD